MTSFNLVDPTLTPIAEKVAAGTRLSREDGIALYASHDLLGIGQLADLARRRVNGDRVYFMVNRHINPTNICRNRCKFCAFARSPGEEGAYEMTLDAIVEAAELPSHSHHAKGPEKPDPRGRTAVVLPEGEMINYLARIPSPVAPYAYFGAATRDGKEDAIVRELQAHPPDWKIMAHSAVSALEG